MKVFAYALVALFAFSAYVAADHTLGTGFSHVTLTALPNADDEVPVCATANGELGAAFCTVTFGDVDLNSIFCSVSHNVVGATAAHLHHGTFGNTGAAVLTFTGPFDDHFEQTFTNVLDADLANFLNGEFYLNIHTTACGPGIIRGQLDAGHNVYSNLDGSQENPAVSTSNTGVAVGIFDSSTLILVNLIHHSIQDAQVTGAHIHNAPVGQNGGIVFPFTDLTNEIQESFTLDVPETRELFGHNNYYNIHTQTFASGEIRGQLTVADAIPRINYAFNLDGSQENPPVSSGDAGCGLFWVDGTTGFMEYSIHHNVQNTSAAHIHLAPVGVNGAVEITLPYAASPITGSVTLSSAQMDNLADGLFYVNIHNDVSPSGAIRGQIVQNNNHYSYLSGTQENPSVTVSSTGCAYLDLQGLNLSYTIFHNIAAPTAAHFHEGTVGNNGAVMVTLDESVNPMSGVAALSQAQADTVDLDGWYINIHSATFPGGEIRGQILGVAAALVAGGGGDPHFFGFDGIDFDLHGAAGTVYNLISDSDLQANFQMVEFEFMKPIYDSFVGSLGFLSALGDSVILDAGSDGVPASLIINGEVVNAADFQGVSGRSFNIQRVENHNVPARLGLGSWHKVAEVYEVHFKRYSFEVFLIETHGSMGSMRFIDFTTSLSGYGHNPEGTLGRTLLKNAEREVSTADDFIVNDGLLGSDFPLNRFQME